jgi:streptomycin 6-kinase
VIDVPDRLLTRLAGEGEAGEAWLAQLPATLETVAHGWGLDLGRPIRPGGMTALVLPVVDRHGVEAVLKLLVPEEEVRAEGDALDLVDGDGAVRLLAQDRARWALLLERAWPRVSLLGAADREAAIDVAADLLHRWWRGVPPDVSIPAAAVTGRTFGAELDRRRTWLRPVVGPVVFDRALDWWRAVPDETPVLLHGDLHLDNVLAADREPWLAIDPKPLVGPAELDLEPLLRDWPSGGGSPREVRQRFDRLTERLGLDRELAADAVLACCLVFGSWDVERGDEGGWVQVRRGVAVHAG